MDSDLLDVLATERTVSALAGRGSVAVDDRAVRLLQAWAAEIDAHPVAVDVAVPDPEAMRRRPRGAARSVAAMTIALTVSSTGIAAAVQGNPFAPIDYVVHKIGDFGHSDRTLPVNLLGTRNGPIGEARQNAERERARQGARPSRSRPAHSSAPSDQAGASSPIEAHRVAGADVPASSQSESGNSHQSKPQRERHHRLVVQRPGRPGPVESPKPDGGETPPNRPEPPSGLPWPKPSQSEPPAPPSEPTTSGPQAAPVR